MQVVGLTTPCFVAIVVLMVNTNSRQRKTKIICTIGPASDAPDVLDKLITAGMNIARFNFSHGTHAEQQERFKRVRQAAVRAQVPVALLLDTRGPEIRTGLVPNGGTIELVADARVCLTTARQESSAEAIAINYTRLPQELAVGNHIYIADGQIDLEVEQLQDSDIICRVISGGVVGGRKNVNVPGVRVSLPAVSEKDRDDIRFGVEQGIDFVASSFVRRAEDVLEIRDLLNGCGGHEVRIIAKIENEEGVANIDAIIAAADGIMIARGDLGVQLAIEQVPLVQKRLIAACNAHGKAVVTATQMLDSMIHNSRPTRAELTDVANALFDGTDAVMLSGETASGAFPVASVRTLHEIAIAVESSPEYLELNHQRSLQRHLMPDVGQAVARSAYLLASEVQAAAIVTPTLRGNTPRMLSTFRPIMPIIAVTSSEQVVRHLLIRWGVIPLVSPEVDSADLMVQNALRTALKSGYICLSDKVVTAAGMPLNSPFPMNSIRVHFMGHVLNRGQEAIGGRCSGRILMRDSCADARRVMRGGRRDVLVVSCLRREYAELVPLLAGIVVSDHSEISMEELRDLNADIVCVVGTSSSFDSFEEGQLVSLDGEEKIIYEGLL